MPRRPRYKPVGFFHLASRGNRRQPIFLDDDDRRRFLALGDEVVRRHRWRCHAYCLMGNHYHLLVETQEPNLSPGMRRLNGQYAQTFNRRHEFDGHLFQDRFHSLVVESEWHLLAVARYVVLNPVRAGLCDHPAGWGWSSYLATAGRAACPGLLTVDWLLAYFGPAEPSAHTSYRRFIDEAPTSRVPES